MATRKQKQELIEKIKFTPVTYTVSISGYGGEIVMGRVDKKVVDYFKENNVDLDEYATNWGEPGEEGYIDVPEDLRPFEMGSWYDCDNIEHCSGAEFGGAYITVTDEKNNDVWNEDLGHNLEDHGCEIECFCSEDVDNYIDEETAVFVGQSFEKGGFFEAELYLKEPFDPAKFKFTYSELAGWPVLNAVEYDGEELDGSNGYSTTGKSSSFEFYTSDTESPDTEEDVPVLEGEEEWAQTAIDENQDGETSSFQTLAATLSTQKKGKKK